MKSSACYYCGMVTNLAEKSEESKTKRKSAAVEVSLALEKYKLQTTRKLVMGGGHWGCKCI